MRHFSNGGSFMSRLSWALLWQPILLASVPHQEDPDYSWTIRILRGASLVSQQKPITARILDMLRGSPECAFEALVNRCPEFTFNELYQEVSRLSRAGQVTIRRGVGIFAIKQAAVMK